LKDHAVPFDFRALKAIQNKPRAQDIYLWMTQRPDSTGLSGKMPSH